MNSLIHLTKPLDVHFKLKVKCSYNATCNTSLPLKIIFFSFWQMSNYVYTKSNYLFQNFSYNLASYTTLLSFFSDQTMVLVFYLQVSLAPPPPRVLWQTPRFPQTWPPRFWGIPLLAERWRSHQFGPRKEPELPVACPGLPGSRMNTHSQSHHYLEQKKNSLV